MDIISLCLILSAIFDRSESSNTKRNQQGEAWMIKSNIVADEFNTLDVQKFERPTSRSSIAAANDRQRKSQTASTGQSPYLTNIGLARSKLESDQKKSSATKFLSQSAKREKSEQGKSSKEVLEQNVVAVNAAKDDKELKKDVTKVKVRQDIEPDPEVAPGESIGKPYGDPDGYQTIGDGIFLMNTQQEAALTSKSSGKNPVNLDTFLVNSDASKDLTAEEYKANVKGKKLPDPTQENLPDILSNLDKNSAKRRSNDTYSKEKSSEKGNSTLLNKVLDKQGGTTSEEKSRNTENMDSKLDYEDLQMNSKGENAGGLEQSSSNELDRANNNDPSADMDAMTPTEIEALQSFQNKLGQEDKVIGKLILTKKNDNGQMEYIKQTNAMLHKENQKQIDNVVEKYKKAESNFIQKNPFVMDKPKLLEKINSTTYQDTAATKRGFLATNDNFRVENVYNSLLKEDEMISKGLNEKAEVRKAISRHKGNPEDEQVSKFLDFLEDEDKKTESDDSNVDVKPKKKSTKNKSKLKGSKIRLLILEPSLGALSDKFSADGTPQMTGKDLNHILGNDEKISKKLRKLKAHLKKAIREKSKFKQEPAINALKNYLVQAIHEKDKQMKSTAKETSIKHTAASKASTKAASHRKKAYLKGSQIKIMEMNGRGDSRVVSKKLTFFNKGADDGKASTRGTQKISKKEGEEHSKEQDLKKERSNYKSRSKKNHKSLKKATHSHKFQKDSKMREGDMKSDLYTFAKTKKKDKKGKDKEYYWQGTVKPETRQLPTTPTEQLRKFGRISNILPVSFEPAAPEGIGQVIGDSNNIASTGTITKETTGFGDTNAETGISKAYEGNSESFRKPILNEIDEDAISSTSFFSGSKSKGDVYNQILKQGVDPLAQKFVNSAIKEINDKDVAKVAGLVSKDSNKVVSMFDSDSKRPKLEEFIDNEQERENEDIDSEEDDSLANKLQGGNKKHKLKIVLHLPEKMDGNIEEIHGQNSEMPIGTIKDLTMQYVKSAQKQSLGEELADDDEDTLEGLLSKPTAKLVEFRPQATVPSTEYVPETVEGKETNEWNRKDNEEQDEVTEEQTKERNDNDYMDNVKSNKLLSMIKHSEELLQNELGQHENREENTEGFINKADESEDKNDYAASHHEKGSSKSLKSKNKSHLKSKKKKKKPKKKIENYYFKTAPTISPNIYADQMNYEQQSREVSQQIPSDTVDKIDQIFNADQHLMPSNFLLEDQKALGKPGIGPLGEYQRRKPATVSKAKMLDSQISASTESQNTQMNTVSENWKVMHHNPHVHLVPESHNLHIEGGKIHGGIINGGFISGGDIEGGDIEGGVITGGKILGGLVKDGRIENGVLNNGTIEGGVIQGGNISGGRIRDGVVAGGKLKGGEIDGGKLSGGEIDGGVLKSGEIRGGFLKSGSVEGGLLKGGTIEGGHLLGGVMLGGKLKGGVVKSGVIKGGTIEGGVVDGGVIEEGVVIKGGVVRGSVLKNSTVSFAGNSIRKTEDERELSDKKIEEDLLNFSNPPSEKVILDKPTTAQMYELKVDTAPQDHFAEPLQQTSPEKLPEEPVAKPSSNDDPIGIATLGAPESWPIESKHKDTKQADSNKHKVASVSYSNAEEQKQKLAVDKPKIVQSGKINKIQTFFKAPEKADSTRRVNETDEFQQLAEDSEGTDQKSLMMRSPTPISMMKNVANYFLKNYGTTTRATIDQRPAIAKYHWSLNSVRGGKIIGSPGKSMSVIGGLKVHNGVATFNDGIDRGYIDAGDFQGECISDPDVCKNGLTLSLTSKIYKDSLQSPTRMYLFDSGAGSEDSKGMALWVNKGRIEGSVSTRKGTWCLGEDLDSLSDRWVDYVMTWHPIKGLYLYANCELLAVSGFGRGCDVCTRSRCHQQDQNTHLMLGRPNKGPHFKLTHFSAGDITIYEDFFNTEGVAQLCGSNNDFLKGQKVNFQRRFSNTPVKSPLDDSSFVMKKHQLSQASEFILPPADKGSYVVNKEFEVWPTPSGLHLLSALFNTPPAAKPIQRETLKVDGGYSEWSSWTSCIGACGGTSMATRYCNDPVPKNGGHDCSMLGPARRTRQCNERNCLDSENVKAIAKFEQSASTDIENDISKRKRIGRVSNINQEKDINELKEEMSILKHR